MVYIAFLIICIYLKIEFILSENENKSHILIDQRQSGKYNIHLSIKDVSIFEIGANEFLDDNSSEKEDYYYDDDDLTIKPWFSTSKKPSSSSINTTILNLNNSSTTPIYVTTIKNDLNTTKPTETSAVTILSIDNNNSPTLAAPTKKPLFSNNPEDIPVQIIMEPVLIPKLRTSSKLPSQSSKDSRVVRLKTKHNPQFPQMVIRCMSGGFVDENGNCRPKRSATINKKMLSLLKDFTIHNNESASSRKK